MYAHGIIPLKTGTAYKILIPFLRCPWKMQYTILTSQSVVQ